MFCTRFILIAIVTLKFFQLVRAGDTTPIPTLDTNPKSTDLGECNTTQCIVRANITLHSGLQFPVKINCASLNETDTGQRNFSYTNELNDLFLNRYKNIQIIAMDGKCTNVQSFSLEYFPNTSLLSATFRNFKIEAVQKDLLQSIGVVKELFFENNAFESVEIGAFNLTSLVSAISFQQNHLKHIGLGAFDMLTNLKALSLYEEDLSIDSEDFFAGVFCENLSIAIKDMPPRVFGKLPEPLIRLQVNNMSFDEIEIQNPKNMSSLLIFDNKIPYLAVIDKHNLKYVNLSNNSLENFQFVNCSQVEILCLRSNHLNELHNYHFAGMEQLKFVYLQENRLKTLSIDIFQSALPVVSKIDLSNNSLQSVSIRPDFNPNPTLKIILNSNPWDCQWILSINVLRPDIFRVFQYEKFVSRINVNGLQCMVYPSYLNASFPDTMAPTDEEAEAVQADIAEAELERTIRRHILFGLMVLAAVAAIISFILYVWVRCRNMVRLPFYQSLKPSQWSPERFDVIRPVAEDDRPDYEIPMEFFNSNTNLEHVELLDTIGSFEPIGLPAEGAPDLGAIYEEIPE